MTEENQAKYRQVQIVYSCFQCGKGVKSGVERRHGYGSGRESGIWFHHACALHFAAALVNDVAAHLPQETVS